MQAVVEGERGHIAEYEDYMNWTKVRNYSKATASSPKLAIIISDFIIHHSQLRFIRVRTVQETTWANAHHDKCKHPPGGSVYSPAHGLSLREVIYKGGDI